MPPLTRRRSVATILAVVAGVTCLTSGTPPQTTVEAPIAALSVRVDPAANKTIVLREDPRRKAPSIVSTPHGVDPVSKLRADAYAECKRVLSTPSACDSIDFVMTKNTSVYADVPIVYSQTSAGVDQVELSTLLLKADVATQASVIRHEMFHVEQVLAAGSKERMEVMRARAKAFFGQRNPKLDGIEISTDCANVESYAFDDIDPYTPYLEDLIRERLVHGELTRSSSVVGATTTQSSFLTANGATQQVADHSMWYASVRRQLCSGWRQAIWPHDAPAPMTAPVAKTSGE